MCNEHGPYRGLLISHFSPRDRLRSGRGGRRQPRPSSARQATVDVEEVALVVAGAEYQFAVVHVDVCTALMAQVVARGNVVREAASSALAREASAPGRS
jgi:hypothetical protein